MSEFVMELADKWDKLSLAGEPTAFRAGYEQALKDCAKELRIASGISIEVSAWPHKMPCDCVIHRQQAKGGGQT